ncbi:hypothetical protein Tco_0720586 [Tanacetum coccineum]
MVKRFTKEWELAFLDILENRGHIASSFDSDDFHRLLELEVHGIGNVSSLGQWHLWTLLIESCVPLALNKLVDLKVDRGMARHSVSSSSSHHQGTASHQHDDG